MDRPSSVEFLRAIVRAHEQPVGGRGRIPILYARYLGGAALQHPAVPGGGWPPWDESVIDELQMQGLIRLSGRDGSQVMPTPRGVAIVASYDRTMDAGPVAPVDGILAALETQAAAESRLAWETVRPVLAALRAYWEEGGLSPFGLAMPAVIEAIPDERAAAFFATVAQLQQAGYLESRSEIATNAGIPVELALTEKAFQMLDGWPGATPEDLLENLIAVLSSAAAQEVDEKRKSKLLEVLGTLKDLGVATGAELIARAIGAR